MCGCRLSQRASRCATCRASKAPSPLPNPTTHPTSPSAAALGCRSQERALQQLQDTTRKQRKVLKSASWGRLDSLLTRYENAFATWDKSYGRNEALSALRGW